LEALRVIAEEGRALVSLLFDASGAPYVSVQEAVATLRPLLRMVEGRNDRVTLHVDRDLETRKFSEHLRLSLIDFRRIFFNLVRNAQAAIPDRGEVTVRVACFQGPRKGLIVEVQDSGVGMDRNTIARAFEIGYRQGSESEGLGLGLPVTQSLTVQAGGLVEV
jgi:signal transduction histidine kinase